MPSGQGGSDRSLIGCLFGRSLSWDPFPGQGPQDGTYTSLGKMPWKGSPTCRSSTVLASSYTEGCCRLSVQRVLNATESTGARKSQLVTETQHDMAAVEHPIKASLKMVS